MKTLIRAPSEITLLNKLGSRKATLIASANGLEPNIPAIVTSRINPKIFANIVHNTLEIVDLKNLENM